MLLLSVEEQMNIIEEMATQMLIAGGSAGALVFNWVGKHGTRLDTSPNNYIWARTILRYCINSGWLYDPALLLYLLEKLKQSPAGSFGSQIPSLVTEIGKRKPDATKFYNGGTAWETCHLTLTLPFLNRKITRRAFEYFENQVLLKPNAARVLIVNGPSGSGKTFTGDFLRLLVGLRANQVGLAEVDFKAWTGQPLTADALVVHLAKQMDSPATGVPPLRNQRPDRWTKELVIWLANEAEITGKTWNLFLDNFHLPGVPENTLIFIEQLMAALAGRPIAWNISDLQMGAPLRLVLSGYEGFVPENNNLIWRENIEPITVEDLNNHFERFYTYKGWIVDENEINAITQRYLPLLPNFFPTPLLSNNGNSLTGKHNWRIEELANLVLRDCQAIEQKRTQG